MKKLFVFCSAAILSISSCSDDKANSPKEGEEQLPPPVENSGPNTEGQRAVEATVNDSANAGTKGDTSHNPH